MSDGGRRPVAARRRIAAVLAAIAVACATAVGAAPAATAQPPTSGPLPTVQIDGVAFAQVVVGGTVYVGGRFSTARPAGSAPRTHTTVRRNLLAYDLATGRLTGWAPRTNGVVRALAVSSDRRTVYAAGDFTRVNGRVRQRIVAIGPGGGVRRTFHPAVNASVAAIAVHGGTVYAGGRFTAAAGAARRYTAAFSGTTGALRRWHPAPDSEVLALVVSDSGRSAVLGGRFGRVNGAVARGSVRVGTAVGTRNLRWDLNRVVGNHGPDAAIWSLASAHGFVYGTGYSYASTVAHRLEGAFVASWGTGAVHWIEDCHGDSYSVAPAGDTVYVVGHAHDCRTIGGFGETDPPTYHRALAFTQAATGTVARTTVKPYSSFAGRPAPTLLDWSPVFDAGSATGQDQGPWSVVTNGDQVLFAGEFTRVDGVRQQGLVRFQR